MLDVNVLIALLEPGHDFFQKAQEWFRSSGRTIGEFVRSPKSDLSGSQPIHRFYPGPRTHEQATSALAELANRPGYRYWPMTESWTALTAPFADRIFGHLQVTDAYLLGMAIKEDGVLVTFDRGLKYMAGAEFAGNLLVLQ